MTGSEFIDPTNRNEIHRWRLNPAYNGWTAAACGLGNIIRQFYPVITEMSALLQPQLSCFYIIWLFVTMKIKYYFNYIIKNYNRN